MSPALTFLPCASTREAHLPTSPRSFSPSSYCPTSRSSLQPAVADASSSRVYRLGRRRKALERAIDEFDRAAPNPAPAHYNSLIEALNRYGFGRRALSVFALMLKDPTAPPDCFSFLLALRICAQLADLNFGEQIHGLLLKLALLSAEDDSSLANGLIHLYAQCDRIDRALRIFERLPAKNIISWNSMIAGYARAEDPSSARDLFDVMPDRNIISWNSMINGYTKNGLPEEALAMFLHLQEVDLLPDEVTLVAIATAMADLGLLYWAKAAHAYAIRRGLSLSGALGVSLISMYSRCGSIGAARRLFVAIPFPNVAHWTAMIAGLAAHGLADAALITFDEMLRSGIAPNHVTFVSILTACSHGGLIEEARGILLLMRDHGVDLRQEHLGCVVDLLARSGRVKDALTLAEETVTDSEAWTALISACRRQGECEVAERAARKLAELEPRHGAGYVLLASIYGEQGNWKEFGQTWRKIKRRGLDKVPGLSWIEVGGSRHRFTAGDGSHRRRREIYAILSSLGNHLRSFDADVDPEILT